MIAVCAQVVTELLRKKKGKKRSALKKRSHLKVFWDYGYEKWDENEFKERLRINRGYV